jgi:hypothetical protein
MYTDRQADNRKTERAGAESVGTQVITMMGADITQERGSAANRQGEDDGAGVCMQMAKKRACKKKIEPKKTR